jgi:cytochrome c peroxidase
LQNPYLDEDIQPLALQESDIDDLVAYLASLTSNDYNTEAVRTLARQRALFQTNRPQRDTARAFGPNRSSLGRLDPEHCEATDD